jgi:hypothetical protein
MNYKFTGCSYVQTQFACSVRCTLNGFKVHTIRKGNLLYTACSPEVGIRNLNPHLRNSAILRTTISIAELLAKKSCGNAIADLQNLTSAIAQLSAVSCQVRYFLVPFPQLVYKNQSKIILELSVSLEAKTFPFLKRQ